MNPLIISEVSILNYKTCLDLITNQLAKYSEIPIGIYFENLKNIRLESLYLLKLYCKHSKKTIIIFDVPAELRMYFYLEKITIKMGCAFFNF